MEVGPGKVAVVTGAARGIGFAVARALAREGLGVVLADRDRAILTTAVDQVRRETGAEVIGVPTDVCSAEQVAELARATMTTFGSVHIVCNNAGILPSGDPWEDGLEAWRQGFEVNVVGVVNGVQAFLPHLARSECAWIVNTASIAAMFHGSGPIYAGTKHALAVVTEHLAFHCAETHPSVGVSLLCPGPTRTSIADPQRRSEGANGHPVSHRERQHQAAIARGADPDDVASAVIEAIRAERYWILTHPGILTLAERRWRSVLEGRDPERFSISEVERAAGTAPTVGPA